MQETTKEVHIMSRKVFISFLETNNYVQCKYDIEGVASALVRFVQEALIEHLCKECG